MGVTTIDQGLVAHLKGTLLHGDSLLTRLDMIHDGDGTGHMAAINDSGCTDDGSPHLHPTSAGGIRG
jgi:hypothetical protein